MYQIILIIENGGNVTPTRCCARRQRTVLTVKNTMNYNALHAAYNNIFTIPFLATKGVALMGVWLHRNLLNERSRVSRACKQSQRRRRRRRRRQIESLSPEKHIFPSVRSRTQIFDTQSKTTVFDILVSLFIRIQFETCTSYLR